MCRSGKAYDILFSYNSLTRTWNLMGTILRPSLSSSSTCLAGLTYKLGRLHISWAKEGDSGMRSSTISPNSYPISSGISSDKAEEDDIRSSEMYYAFSDDSGRAWQNSKGIDIANLSHNLPLPSSKNASISIGDAARRVPAIPLAQGYKSLESQCVDAAGGFHILCREQDLDGPDPYTRLSWMHYHRSSVGSWSRRSIRIPGHEAVLTPTERGLRGEIGVVAQGDLFVLLPSNDDSSCLSLVSSRPIANSSNFQPFELLWQGYGFAGEPLIDETRLRDSGILSVLTRTIRPATRGYGEVVVLDFEVGGSCIAG